jgi:hypothetical protein
LPSTAAISATNYQQLRFRQTDGHVECGEQPADAAFDLVADRADGVDVEAGRVLQHPVLVTAAGEHRAGVGGADDLRGSEPGNDGPGGTAVAPPLTSEGSGEHCPCHCLSISIDLQLCSLVGDSHGDHEPRGAARPKKHVWHSAKSFLGPQHHLGGQVADPGREAPRLRTLRAAGVVDQGDGDAGSTGVLVFRSFVGAGRRTAGRYDTRVTHGWWILKGEEESIDGQLGHYGM